jgi:thioester reductase-like protein
MKILLFGGTGFLGKYLVKELSAFASQIYIVTRNKNSQLFKDYAKVTLVSGDITDIEVIKDQNIKNQILAECDLVIHAAALYDLTACYEDLYLHNVVGTQNVLQLLKKAEKLKAFYYVSTIAVVDEQSTSIIIDEVTLPERTVFHDDYSKTKYFAEKMVRQSLPNTAVRIIRPGAIVGDSLTGEIENINGPYYFVELLKKFRNLLKAMAIFPLTFNPETLLHFIPVDHVANLISLLIKRDEYSREIKTYHLVCIDPPSTQKFINDISQDLGIATKFYPIPQNKVFSLVMPLLKIPKEIIPFMFSKISYDKTLTLKDLPELKNSKYADFKKIFFVK